MPRKIKVPKIIYHYVPGPDSEERVRQAYFRLFDLAWAEMQRKESLEKKVSSGNNSKLENS